MEEVKKGTLSFTSEGQHMRNPYLKIYFCTYNQNCHETISSLKKGSVWSFLTELCATGCIKLQLSKNTIYKAEKKKKMSHESMSIEDNSECLQFTQGRL
jgi:hypothetical protein